MKLNCDLGESFGTWQMHADKEIMPFIDMASIACGFHAGDPVVMAEAIGRAGAAGVSLGAHPAYPDLQGFGRRSMVIPSAELIAMMHYQIAALDGMAAVQRSSLDYVKPHGALYNDMMRDEAVFNSVLTAIATYPRHLPLVIQALPDMSWFQRQAEKNNVELWCEAFADRRYRDDGRLTSRQQAGSVLDTEQMLEQARLLIEEQCVLTESGSRMMLQVDTLCVHGDTPAALAGVKAIRTLLPR